MIHTSTSERRRNVSQGGTKFVRNWLPSICAVLLVALAASAARADLVCAVPAEPAEVLPVAAAVEQASCSEQLPAGTVGHGPLSLPAQFDEPLARTDLAASSDGPQDVCLLPPGPDSTTLFLSALASLGVWHLGRSAKKINLAHLPDWYHTGGPIQIGHTFVLDLEFNALPPCSLDQPQGVRPLHYRLGGEPPPRFDPQCMLTSVSPCGPPLS